MHAWQRASKALACTIDMLNYSKITNVLLSQKFSGDEWPIFNHAKIEGEQIQLQLSVPDSLSFFAGHFPEQAVLPGIVQIHWAGELAMFLFEFDGFTALKNVKFNSMVLPNSQLTLNLKYNQTKQTLRFDYTSEKDKFSSGVLAFTLKQGAL